MAKSTIADLFRRRDQLPAEVADAIARLGQLAERSPELSEAAAIQSAILRTVYQQPQPTARLGLTQARAAEKLHAGEPLLRDEQLQIDTAAVEATMVQLCQALGKHVENTTDPAAIAAAIGHHKLNVAELVSRALGGQAAGIRERAAELDLNADLLRTMLRFSLFPIVSPLVAELAQLRSNIAWQHGDCPNCGGPPLLGEHRGLEQLRYLRCGLCASEWQIDRLLCPFCGTREAADLGYLHVEGADHQRAATCDSCRGYVKVLASLGPFTPLDLIVEDLATLHLDMIALERGYTAP